MNRDLELIHELLDDELSKGARKEILKKMDSAPDLKKEFLELNKVLSILECSEKISIPASFTSDVMESLPVRRGSYIKEVRDFLFKGRVFRWNAAAALATAFFLIIGFVGIYQSQKKHGLVSYTGTPSEAIVTVKINFYAPEAKRVAIAGDFNKWRIDDRLLRKQDNGIWTIELPMELGVYNYMFVVDGKVWVTDPNAELYQDDGFGNKNSVLMVSKL